MQSELPAVPPLPLPDYLPGAKRPAQMRHTLTLHTPVFASLPPLRDNLRRRLETWQITPADTSMILFTVTEVLTNLIKHPPRKASVVHVTLEKSPHSVSVDISDDATPFATFAAKCQYAAKPRTQPVEDIKTGGYGLSCLVEMHPAMEYAVAANSADGRNHFRVTIPVTTSPSVTTAPVKPLPQRAQYKYTRPKPLVYLVDDNSVTLAIHQDFLSAAYTVKSFGYATDALASFCDDNPDIIIADMALPDMEGVSFRQHLCALPGGRETPFVFLSSHLGRGLETYASLAGIDDFLYKPVSSERLLGVVGRLIRRVTQIASTVHGNFDRKINGILHPTLPRHAAGWDIATRNSRAEAGGGDFILYHHADNRLFGVVADVMGHGRDAKFFACAYAGYLRSLIQVLGRASSPGAFLAQLSAAIHEDSFFDLSVMTCLVFEIAPQGRICLATAGHPPPSLCRYIGERYCATEIDLSGPLPGLVDTTIYQEARLQLRKNERLLIATDGYWTIAERRGPLHMALESAAALISKNQPICCGRHISNTAPPASASRTTQHL